jgi:hypothetical protein
MWDAGVNITDIIDTVVNDIKDSDGVTTEVMNDVQKDLADFWDEFAMVCCSILICAYLTCLG